MPSRKRDHKAEYQAAKERARRSGYQSVRQAKRATSIKRANKKWSDERSRMPSSRFESFMDDEQAAAYNRAFVQQYSTRAEKLDAIHDYLIDYSDMTESEWEQNYGLKAE